jgi:hypothetical protein
MLINMTSVDSDGKGTTNFVNPDHLINVRYRFNGERVALHFTGDLTLVCLVGEWERQKGAFALAGNNPFGGIVEDFEQYKIKLNEELQKRSHG